MDLGFCLPQGMSVSHNSAEFSEVKASFLPNFYNRIYKFTNLKFPEGFSEKYILFTGIVHF